MSKIFNYSGVKDTLNFNGKLPGQLGDVMPGKDIYAALANETIEDGQLVFVDSSKDLRGFVARVAKPIEESDTAVKFTGIVLKDVHGQLGRSALGSQHISEYAKGQAVSVLTQGSVHVPVQDAGAITANGKVYVRIAESATNANLPIGGIETASISGETVEWTNAKFTGLYGYPQKSTADGTTATALTGRTAEIVIE